MTAYDQAKFDRLSFQADGLRAERDAAKQVAADLKRDITASHLWLRRRFSGFDPALADVPPSQWLTVDPATLQTLAVRREEIETLIAAQARVESVRARIAELDRELSARVAVVSRCRDWINAQTELKVYAP